MFFCGVYYEVGCIDIDGNEWFVYIMRKVCVGDKIGLVFELEVIYVMCFGEMEEEFDKWFDSYDEV